MPSIEYRPDRPKRYRARYWGPDGKLHSRSFARKDDAQRWLVSEEASKLKALGSTPAGHGSGSTTGPTSGGRSGLPTRGEARRRWRRPRTGCAGTSARSSAATPFGPSRSGRSSSGRTSWRRPSGTRA